MNEKKFEYKKSETEIASQATKDEFLRLVDILTERASLRSVVGLRMKSYDIDNGKKIEIIYGSKGMYEKNADPNLIVAQVNVVEIVNNRQKRQIFKLRRNGVMDYDATINNPTEQRPTSLEEIVEMAKRKLSEIKEKIASEKQTREMGALLVTEAEAQEINTILERLVKQEKEEERRNNGEKSQSKK